MNFLKKIVDGIDDSHIVKQAYRVLYYVIGVLCALGTIAAAIYAYKFIAGETHEFKEIKSWSKFVFWLMFTVYTAAQIVAGVILFLYWKKHGDAIGSSTSKYPNNLVLADLLQSMNNSYVFIGLVSIVVGCTLLYLWFILTGEADIYSSNHFLLATGSLVGVIVGYIIIFMILTMIVNFIAEKIKQRVQISDDLSDVADVMRSAQIVKDENTTTNVTVTETAQKTCPDCGGQVPPNTATCPNCGCPINN